MNEAHLHLLVNHFPIILPIVGLSILLFGFILRSNILKRTAFIVFFVGGLTAFAAHKTGEAAEEIVEEIQGVDHDLIHEHEEASELFARLSIALGLVSLLAFWFNWKEKSYEKYVAWLIAIIAATVIFLSIETGRTGGEIRHQEIRKNYTIDAPSIDEHLEEAED